MDKLIITTIIAGLMIISCSKDSIFEANQTTIPADTTTTQVKDSVLSQVLIKYGLKPINHHVFLADTIAGRRNIKVDSLKIVSYTDSTRFSYKFYHMGNWTEISGLGNGFCIFQKAVWKKF
jgi:hypothetical protein